MLESVLPAHTQIKILQFINSETEENNFERTHHLSQA